MIAPSARRPCSILGRDWLPPGIAVSVSEPRKIRHKKVLLIVLVVSVFAGAVYLWLHGLFG